MEPQLVFSRVADLSADERAAVTRLSLAVYPPDEWKDWPGWKVEWADPEWCVRVMDADGALRSYTGVFLREGAIDGRLVRIGGVGSVKTHPSGRGRGYARLGLERALAFFREAPDVAFALLVCEPHLIPFYSGQGWQEFNGELLVRQRGVVERFTFNRAMTHRVAEPAPTAGTVDLGGAPW
jgi:GNAT superfamily N-acetyltransferase